MTRVRHIEAVLALAQRRGRAAALATAQMYAGNLYLLLREPRKVREYAEPLLELAAAKQLPWALAAATLYQGWVLVQEGRHDEGIAELRQGLGDQLATGQRAGQKQGFAWLAEAYLCAGAPGEGLAVVADALAAVPKEERDVPELLRLRGDLLAARGAGTPQAEASYREAIGVARRLGAKAYELRAATGLARLLRSDGRAREALDLLAPCYASFSEGFDTRDLREARTLLEELE